jgi:hypothetical protein
MKKYVFMIIISFFCLYLTACYVEYGCDISKKLNKTVIELEGKYIVDGLGFSTYGGEPNTNLFQKRGSDNFESFYFSIQKRYIPQKKNINIEIKNSVYKLKNNEKVRFFSGYRKSNNDLYYIWENKKLQRHYVSYEERKNGFIGGYSYYLEFQEPVKARQLDYIEFDITITDEEGNEYTHHLHYDITIRTVFNMGSTLWEYWSSI